MSSEIREEDGILKVLCLFIFRHESSVMKAEISIIIAKYYDAGYRRLHMAGDRVGRTAWLQVQLLRGTASSAP